jgi:hypothetical protein
MNEQTKELAKQAGFHIASSNLGDIGWVWCSDGYPIDEQLDALVKLVRADEREACAMALETGVDFKGIETEPLLWKLCLDVVVGCVAVIRARGQK